MNPKLSLVDNRDYKLAENNMHYIEQALEKTSEPAGYIKEVHQVIKKVFLAIPGHCWP
jgi:hypothetical protein